MPVPIPFPTVIMICLFAACWSGDAGESRVGSYRGSITWDGLERTYLIHVPTSWNKSTRMPLVIALHGGTGTGETMVKMTRGGFDALADRDGFIVVYPDGLTHAGRIRTRWNDGRDDRFSQADDVGFLSALIDHLGETLNIDRCRVYATGISNGAQMVMRLARELPDKIAAVAPVAYAMPERLASVPVSTRPISVLVMTGTKDPLIPWEGGETPDFSGERRLGRLLSLPRTLQVLATHNRCTDWPKPAWVSHEDAGTGPRIRQERWVNCKNGVEVVLCAVEGGGHTWPGGLQSPETPASETNRASDACEIIWAFFKRHQKSN
ncbi:MAG: PHB depolymerase family esterase [Acidobacteriota bacterium]